ncbi:MAG: tRNA (adenosine(37)-N6)-threonylcarbamoyltransferase complex dimerization subunit type 1 TsaB [Pseudomonadota bacterium]
MNTILALDASTDACSVALAQSGATTSVFELVPREHNHRLFSMLREVLPSTPQASCIELIAFAQGPGSFTGLRVAASAAQGLAYTLDVPAVGLSSLACLAQGSLRRGLLTSADKALVMLDARINEIYVGLYRFQDGLAVACCPDQVVAPDALPHDYLREHEDVVAMGSGLKYLDTLPVEVRRSILRVLADQWPDSVDLLPLARASADQGALLTAAEIQPVYLRNEVNWKKLPEQGPQRG